MFRRWVVGLALGLGLFTAAPEAANFGTAVGLTHLSDTGLVEVRYRRHRRHRRHRHRRHRHHHWHRHHHHHHHWRHHRRREHVPHRRNLRFTSNRPETARAKPRWQEPVRSGAVRAKPEPKIY